jgi:hypothetical protein
MKDAQVLIMSEEWMTVEEARKRLGKSQRSLQKLAKAGHLRTKRQPREGRGPETLYFAEDVERLVHNAPPKRARPALETAATASKYSRALAITSDKPTREMQNAFLSVLEKAQQANDALLAQLERQAKLGAATLENVVAQIFAAQKADRDAVTERLNAERKDRQDRLQLRRGQTAPPTAKTKKARAS